MPPARTTADRAAQVLGTELAGRIAHDSPLPPGCPFKHGDRVFGAAQGAYGEKVAARWQQLSALPDNMTFDQGAGASCALNLPDARI